MLRVVVLSVLRVRDTDLSDHGSVQRNAAPDARVECMRVGVHGSYAPRCRVAHVQQHVLSRQWAARGDVRLHFLSHKPLREVHTG